MTIEWHYFQWLCSLVTPLSDPNPSRTRYLLLEALFKAEFTWRVDHDDNRAEDGTNLRDDFCDIVGSWEGSRFPFEPCTVLEMLIALAKRLAFETNEDEMDEGLYEWFWRMIENLGLIDQYDEEFNPLVVGSAITRFVHRWYDRNGHGGLFPLNHATDDQRETEIWMQMSAYLSENYGQDYLEPDTQRPQWVGGNDYW